MSDTSRFDVMLYNVQKNYSNLYIISLGNIGPFYVNILRSNSDCIAILFNIKKRIGKFYILDGRLFKTHWDLKHIVKEQRCYKSFDMSKLDFVIRKELNPRRINESSNMCS